MKTYLKALLPVLVTLALPVLAFAQEHSEEVEHATEHHGGVDVTMLIASFVNFFVLISVFIYLFRDKVTSSLKERRAAIENELNEAQRLRKEAEAKHKEYSDRLAKLDQEAEQQQIPASEVEAYKKVRTAQEYAAWIYLRAGHEVLVQEGKPGDDQQAYERGQLILREWMEKQDVTIDPRFGRIDENGDVVAPDGELSIPVSDLAKKGADLPPLTSRDSSYADAGAAQKIVSRMIMGGSAGFRMMIALPDSAPPMFSTPAAVVRVNSSMFCRVPGPALTDDTEATISA